MTIHLTLPCKWEECIDFENCHEYVHREDSAEDLNKYPREWLLQLLPPECVTSTETINLFYRRNKNDPVKVLNITERLPHSDVGAAIEEADGALHWIYKGNDHRENGPASIWADGTRQWCFYDVLHRVNGPAIEHADGGQQWYHHGKRHRENGPAVESADGTREWWQNGKRHRENGPAVTKLDGTQEWWLNDERHRVDGPAEIDSEGIESWFIHGKHVNKPGFYKILFYKIQDRIIRNKQMRSSE